MNSKIYPYIRLRNVKTVRVFGEKYRALDTRYFIWYNNYVP